MWALHNALKGWTLYGLNEREVQLIINSLSATELKLLSVCHLTEKAWIPFDLQKHATFISETAKNKNHFPEPSNLGSANDADPSYFVVKPKKAILPRLHQRIDIEIDASIEGQVKKFDSQTVDLSEGGIYFKDVIPDWVSGYFIVSINYNNKSYQIMCALVEDQKIKHRVQVMSEESDVHYMNYKTLLDQLRKST